MVCMAGLLLLHALSMSCAGLTRASILFRKMDCRVKPGNDIRPFVAKPFGLRFPERPARAAAAGDLAPLHGEIDIVAARISQHHLESGTDERVHCADVL